MSTVIQNDFPQSSVDHVPSSYLSPASLALPTATSASVAPSPYSTSHQLLNSNPLTLASGKSLSGLEAKTPNQRNSVFLKWNAAEESVRNMMAMNQDIVTPATVPKARAKTGGRRGRGGRKSIIKTEPQDDTNTRPGDGNSINLTPSGAAQGRGGARARAGGRPRVRPTGGSGRGNKRKRARSEEDVVIKDDTDASETFTPLPAQSRSGRRIFKATNFSPAVIDLEASTSTKNTKRTAHTVAVGSGRKGKKRYRKSGDASVCKNCGRGHSSIGNMIVFCDGCNTPWHQYCHDKPIGAEAVQIEEKEWFCADCAILREERVHLEGKVSAEGMSIAEKRNYLRSLSTFHLVSLLLHATNLHPNLPIFPAAHTSLNSSAPPGHASAPVTGVATNATAREEEDTYDLYAESDPLPYPKAGNGIPLPPESEDLTYLIDDDTVTFSHCWDWDQSDLLDLGQIDGAHNIGWAGALVDVGA